VNSLRISLNARKGFVCSAAMAMALVLLGGANALANTVWQVSKSSSNATCTLSATTCNTIQSAANAASPLDVILVGPGIYKESVYIDTSNLTILGAQAGKDARNRQPINESIVDATGQGSGPGYGAGFYVDVDNTVIDGFTIQGGTGGAYATGVYSAYDDEGVYTEQYINNIIQNNAVGIYMYENYDGAVVKHNLIKNNNKGAKGSGEYDIPGPGFGVVLDECWDGIAVTQNAFSGNMAAAVFVDDSGEGVDVTQNTSNGDGALVVLYEAEDGVSISQNVGSNFGAKGFMPVTGTTNAGAAIELFYENYEILISDNVLVGGKAAGYNGIDFSAKAFLDNSADYVCEDCQISNNQISQFTGDGIVAEASETGPTLDYSGITANQVQQNGGVGILIGASSENYYNTVLNNHMEENHTSDCEDETIGSGSGTPATADTWVNNVGWGRPVGLCNYTGE